MFFKIYTITPWPKACYSQGKRPPFDEELVFSKMPADRGISLLCSLEVKFILEVQNGLYMDDN